MRERLTIKNAITRVFILFFPQILTIISYTNGKFSGKFKEQTGLLRVSNIEKVIIIITHNTNLL